MMIRRHRVHIGVLILIFLVISVFFIRNGDFLKPQVRLYRAENSPVVSNQIRKVAASDAVWLGYAGGGMSMFDGNNWKTQFKPSHVNALLPVGDSVYIGTDSTIQPLGGVLRYDRKSGQIPDLYNATDNLPDYRVYSLTEYQGNIYAGTYTGIAEYNLSNKTWSLPYSVQKGNIFNDQVHALTFTQDGDIWVGHIVQGISWYSKQEGWQHLGSIELQGGGIHRVLGGDNIRAIVQSPSDKSIWIASDGGEGGVTSYTNGHWKIYGPETGLPVHVQDLAFDWTGRPWAATSTGIFYLNGDKWVEYQTGVSQTPSYSIAFWNCYWHCPFFPPFGQLVVVGTQGYGLVIGQLPLF